MQVVVDRIEDGFAVCEMENGTMLNLGLIILPEGVQEGTVLDIEDEKVTINFEETSKRKEEADKLLNELFKKNKR